jgi:signal transduction histidine kinase
VNQVLLNPVTLVYHEVRTPLGLLTTAARALAEDCDGDELLRRQCQVVLTAAERVLLISNQVLGLAASTKVEHADGCRPAETVSSVIADLRDLGVPLTLQEGPGVAEVESSVPGAQFETVLHSLIMNAVDHGLAGDEITVTTRVEGDVLCVEISNTMGPARHKGLGVGMYLCAEVVKGFGGEIEARSNSDRYEVALKVPLATARVSS